MPVNIGINGFGRIGRLITRVLAKGHPALNLVGINARAESSQLAHLLKYDSVHRTYDQDVSFEDEAILVNGKRIAVSRRGTPAEIPWGELGVDVVLETTGKFKDITASRGHLDQGAKKVVISAPAKDVHGMFVMGVNHTSYDPNAHHVVSNASCTTNCLAPPAKVINDVIGIEHGLMTTIHSYTMSQRILDGSHKDIRRARAAAMSMIPTSTGAARAVTQVIPELAGKMDGMSVRVPTPNVSVVDFTFRTGRDTTAQEINDALAAACEGPLKGIMKVDFDQLVSVDYTSSPLSSIVDGPITQVMDKRLAKVFAWYDNEMGYASRVMDLAAYMAGFMA